MCLIINIHVLRTSSTTTGTCSSSMWQVQKAATVRITIASRLLLTAVGNS